MIEVNPPSPLLFDEVGTSLAFYLAGSNDVTGGERWQTRLKEILQDANCIIYDPFRPYFATLSFDERNDQLQWEQEAQSIVDSTIFYLDPRTRSHDTLLELGWALGSENTNVIVCCPDGYEFKDRVVLLTESAGAHLLNTFNELIEVFAKPND